MAADEHDEPVGFVVFDVVDGCAHIEQVSVHPARAGQRIGAMLLDYVADLRASTPTDAAKRIVPDVAEQLALITQLRDRARRSVRGWLDREQAYLEGLKSRPALAPVLSACCVVKRIRPRG